MAHGNQQALRAQQPPRHLDLDAGLGNRDVGRPLGYSEAGVRRGGKGPKAEVRGLPEFVSAHVVAVFTLEAQAQSFRNSTSMGLHLRGISASALPSCLSPSGDVSPLAVGGEGGGSVSSPACTAVPIVPSNGGTGKSVVARFRRTRRGMTHRFPG